MRQVTVIGEWNRNKESVSIKVYESEKIGLATKRGKLIESVDEFFVGSDIWKDFDEKAAKAIFENNNPDLEVLLFSID